MTPPTVARLAEIFKRRSATLVPGAFNALSARAIADLGYETIYVTGAGVTNGALGMPDIGLITMTELANTVTAIRDCVETPLIVDADTGFGNAVNTMRTVRALERAGADAVQIEDQVFPKKCGHFAGKEVAPLDEMLGKIKAAVDTRRHMLVVARTDARAVNGLDDAIERAQRFVEAGADAVFIEAPRTVEELARITREVDAPHFANMVLGGLTPVLAREELERLGFSVALYANAALQAALLGMQNALARLKQDGRLDEASGLMATFAERQRIVGKPDFDRLEKKYAISSE